MIHPSYVDLMKVVNKGVEEGEEPVISSRYSIVMATSRRARQLIAGDEPLVRVKAKEKPLSIAVDELNQGQIKILTDEEKEALKAELEAEAAETEETEVTEEVQD
ncbi:MAG: DNA-directed RNA polymerase subunit omega [Butyrivibrio sp.]|nr:DNA-directed RNA polymerase subunit omega [Butyrivibrio sp.]